MFCSRSQKCIFLRFGAKGERIIASGNGPSGTYHNRSILKKQKRNGTLRSYHGAQYHCPLLHCLVHLCFVYKGKGLAAESTILIDCDFSYYCCEYGIYFSIFFPPALRILIKRCEVKIGSFFLTFERCSLDSTDIQELLRK